MRVLFVTSMHPTPANPQRGVIVARLASAIRERGHEVEIFPLGHAGGPWRYVGARRRVAAALRASPVDVLHAHFGYSGLAVPRTTVPVITSFYGDDLNGTWAAGGGTSAKSKIGVLISQLAALRSTRCIAVSEALRSRLWFASTRRKTVVVRDAVDPTLFRAHPREQARKTLGIPDDQVLILFPHDVTQATKRVWLAEAAVEELKNVEPMARLWVVNGRQADEMPWYYAAADAMIVTSASEGGPSSAKEALSCGIPVVSVAVGDIHLFSEAPTAAVCATSNPEGLAMALRDVLARYQGRPRRSLLPPGLTLREAAGAIETVYAETTDRGRLVGSRQ